MERKPENKQEEIGITNSPKEKAVKDLRPARIQYLTEVCECYWNLLCNELENCKQLILQHVLLSERFRKCHSVWKKRVNCFPKPTKKAQRTLHKVDIQLRYINNLLEESEDMAHSAMEFLTELCNTFQRNLPELQKELVNIGNSAEGKPLGEIKVPWLDKFDPATFPHIRPLQEQWNSWNLTSKLDKCFRALDISE